MTKATWLGAAVMLAGITLAAACGHRDVVGQSSARLVAPVDSAGFGMTNASSIFQMNEPSGDFVDDRTFVVGANDTNSERAWFVSTDNGHTFDRQCSFDGTVLGGTLPCSKVPDPSPVPKDADGNNIWHWAHDPVVRADGKGNVVYLGLGDGTSDHSDGLYVAASVSSNGAASWDSTVLVNDAGCGSSGFSEAVDQPNAVFDLRPTHRRCGWSFATLLPERGPLRAPACDGASWKRTRRTRRRSAGSKTPATSTVSETAASRCFRTRLAFGSRLETGC